MRNQTIVVLVEFTSLQVQSFIPGLHSKQDSNLRLTPLSREIP